MQIGDYVNYPVYYDNVNGSTLKGWRVISKNIDLDGNPSPGTVNLVSAGVPLTYYHKNLASTSVNNLTVKFLETPFTGNDDYTYRKNGFLPNATLTEIFTNKYTNVSGERLQVRAMKVEDIYNIIQSDELKGFYDTKYQKLFANNANYLVIDDNLLWQITSQGDVYGNRSYITNGIRPIVSLCSSVKASNINMVGTWNIEI